MRINNLFDPGSGIRDSNIQIRNLGFGINIPDPQLRELKVSGVWLWKARKLCNDRNGGRKKIVLKDCEETH